MKRLENKTALITGGASGLGKATAQRLASEGARVVISDIQVDLGRTTAAQGGFTFIEHNVCDENRWNEVIREVESRVGKLDILVNNAGIVGPVDKASPEDTPLENWRRVFAVNVEGVFLGCRAGISAMRRTGSGSIINISSVAGLVATPIATAYGASKAVVRHLTKSVAQHCAEHKLNIRCNSVHPGDVMTPLWEKLAPEFARTRGMSVDALLEKEKSLCPMGDFVRAEDVAAAVAYLASPDARFVTGDALIVDGGYVNCDSYGRE